MSEQSKAYQIKTLESNSNHLNAGKEQYEKELIEWRASDPAWQALYADIEYQEACKQFKILTKEYKSQNHYRQLSADLLHP